MSENGGLRKVLGPFLGEPDKTFKFMDIRPTLNEMSGDSIRKDLQKLEKDKILDVDFSRGRPKGGNKTKTYRIRCEISIFRKLFPLYTVDCIYELFSSRYMDSIIKKVGLEAICGVIKQDLEITNFRTIASKALLRQPSTINEYQDRINFIGEFLSAYAEILHLNEQEAQQILTNQRELWKMVHYQEEPRLFDSYDEKLKKNIRCFIRPFRSNRIDILTEFEYDEAIHLYRNTMHKEIRKLFSDLAKNMVITQGLYQFMEQDSYLSPFTSYPQATIQGILFGRPFQRIYDDIYLLSEKDLSIFCSRTATLYNNFGEILFQFFRTHLGYLPDLNLYTRQFIFQWNVARTNFDNLWEYLSDVYKEKIGSGKYHIFLEGADMKIIDLETNEPIPECFEIKNYDDYVKDYLVVDEIRSPIIDNMFSGLEIDVWDPYSILISSFWGRDLNNCPTIIPMDRVLIDINSEFSKRGLNVKNI
jgi:hypothetical protein